MFTEEKLDKLVRGLSTFIEIPQRLCTGSQNVKFKTVIFRVILFPKKNFIARM